MATIYHKWKVVLLPTHTRRNTHKHTSFQIKTILYIHKCTPLPYRKQNTSNKFSFHLLVSPKLFTWTLLTVGDDSCTRPLFLHTQHNAPDTLLKLKAQTHWIKTQQNSHPTTQKTPDATFDSHHTYTQTSLSPHGNRAMPISWLDRRLPSWQVSTATLMTFFAMNSKEYQMA